VVANIAEMRLAEAATIIRVINVGSEVLSEGANLWLADAFAVLNAPSQASCARFWSTDTLAQLRVEYLVFVTPINMTEALAFALFSVEIIINAILCCTGGLNITIAVAVIAIPVVVGRAVDWRTMALASIRVPEEIVGADLWAADTRANAFIEDHIVIAICWSTFAGAIVNIEILAWLAGIGNSGVALASALLVVPVLAAFARVITIGLNANAVANFCVEII